MGAALLVSRPLLACVFWSAGAAKLAGLGRPVVGFGVLERLAGGAGVGLPIAQARSGNGGGR